MKTFLSLLVSVSLVGLSLTSCTSTGGVAGGNPVGDYINSAAGQQAIKDAEAIAVRVIMQIIGNLMGGAKGNHLTLGHPTVQAAIEKAQAEILAKHPKIGQAQAHIIAESVARAQITN